MPRKQNQSNERFNDPFPSALRALMKKHSTTQEELSTYLGLKTRQSITGYCDGSTSPTIETLAKIASYYDVSTDYLLGITRDPARIPSAVDRLGLRPEAVHSLISAHESAATRNAIQGLDLMLEEAGFLSLLSSIYDLVELAALPAPYRDLLPGDQQELHKKRYPFSKTARALLSDMSIGKELEKKLIEEYPELSGYISVSYGIVNMDKKLDALCSRFRETAKDVIYSHNRRED